MSMLRELLCYAALFGVSVPALVMSAYSLSRIHDGTSATLNLPPPTVGALPGLFPPSPSPPSPPLSPPPPFSPPSLPPLPDQPCFDNSPLGTIYYPDFISADQVGGAHCGVMNYWGAYYCNDTGIWDEDTNITCV